ncbi:MAG: 4-hydroxythreonine-4-phosphate dehydrogenase PdxA [Pseudomarimonas sp.]
MRQRPRLALVPGEPGGVGPELCVRLAQRALPCDVVVYADPSALRAAADTLGLPLELLAASGQARPGALPMIAITQATATRFGVADPANAAAVIAALTRAGQACIDGECDGLVTGPVNKASVNAGGIVYRGTTELLAEQAGAEVVMMLASPRLRVALATTHLPLRAVADAIQKEPLSRCLRILHAALRGQFGIAAPRIAVLGLNPHAGESGILGTEEIDVIEPVMRALRAEGFDLRGPLPADTAFLPQMLVDFDAVLAMYHDQGLPVLKHGGFEQAVNLTLGLPYPRVAVDHGTALDLAGRGVADASSLIHAFELCAQLAAPPDSGTP